ncbi:MutS domain V [Selenomonas sp. GACV-9]|uniref:MutS-related protein n=1 Tax=Selenomonas sp. GACV-9 TaxID=3158782 RepID=UPI0008E3B8C7|nr:MutS domain V [Selenomonas ruminantium]
MKTHISKRHFYETIRETDIHTASELKQRNSRYTILRTISFLAMVFAFAAGYDGYPAGNILGLLLLGFFLLLVHRHNQLHQKQQLLDSHLAATSACIDRFSDKWKAFPDTGAQFLHPDRPQETDLHIFGPASLYQYLSCARTQRGRSRLAAALTTTPPARTKILARQQAVAELIEHPRFCLNLIARAAMLKSGHDTTGLLAEIEQDPPHGSHSIVRYHTAWILPAITIISLLLAAFDALDWTIPGLLTLLQLLLTTIFHRHNQEVLAPLADLTHELHHYESLFYELEQADFTSTTLVGLQQRLRDGGASRSLRRLAKLADCVALSRNFFFFVLANTLLLWDCHMAVFLTRWRDDAAVNLREWIDIWSEMETLLSLATVGHTRETWVFPQLSTGTPALQARNLRALLIAEERAVPNDADFTAGTRIITGSNMSGKTTYMRTLASSAVLAYAGAPVCAERFSLTPLHIFTSIQVNDDLSQGISTFYAELLRIKQMVEFSHQEQPMLICIDEIFKGTNSADRIIGAQEAIRHLTRAWCITLVTTHDFELCDLTSPNEIPVTNCHFEEYYEDDKIRFDYKLKPGRCQTTNAQYLLRMAGIITSERAAEN